MKIPFSVEYYIDKAKKMGYSISEIKIVLTSPQLWNKLINEKKKFKNVFYFYLDLNREEGQPKKSSPQTYKRQFNRLF